MTRYELAERIGSGGMAEIFKAMAIAAGGFEKPVAIKRILPHLSQDKRFVELLIAEANILSHLRHRNIVQIFDVGLGPDGQYFLVMEYVDGIDLGCMQSSLEARQKRLPVDLGLQICSEVCEALEQAHTARGPDGEPMRLVHRDVSPSNVLLSRSGEVKLTDFGIAKRPEEVTGHGTVRGKFAYISPEQAFNTHVDARSDVFSVGILLWELLLGRRLFSQMADFEALKAVREASAPRIRQIDPAIDPRLDNIVTRALARNPDDRFQSAGDLGKELRVLRYSLPSTSRDPAKELAGLVARCAADASRGDKELSVDGQTVVRLKSAAGFSLSTGDYDESLHQSYADARQILNIFEEEVTRTVNPQEIGLWAAQSNRDDEDSMDATIEASMDSAMVASLFQPELSEEETVVVDKPSFPVADNDAGDVEDRPTKMVLRPPLDSPGNARPDSAHTPAGATLDRDMPGQPDRGSFPFEPGPGGLRHDPLAFATTHPYSGGGSMPPGAGPVAMPPGGYGPMGSMGASPQSRRKRWIILGLGIAGTALLSFAIAAAALNSGGAATPDAAVADAAPPDAEPDASVPDAGEPDAKPAEQKVTPKKKRKRRFKKRRRNPRKRTKKTTGKSGTKKSTDKTTSKKTTSKKTTSK